MSNNFPPITEKMTQIEPKYHFESIDILRGFAALSVVVYHVIEHFGWKEFPSTGILSWFRIGWMGVDLFFVISGFVIGLSAFSLIDKGGVKKFRGIFFNRRLVRILPLHYLTIFVFVTLITPELLFEKFWINLSVHLLFVHNLIPVWHGAINGVNWSIATEMQFYLLMLFIAPWIRVTKWWVVAVMFIGIAWAWRYGVTQLVQPSQQLGSFPLFIAATQLPGMLDEFVAGMLLARFVRSESGENFIKERKCFHKLLLLVLVASTAWLSLAIFWRNAGFWDNTLMVVMYRSLLALTFAFVLLLTTTFTVTGVTRRILSPLFYLGTISYGIYLWHLPVLLSLKRISWISNDLALILVITITIGFASISWHFFEQPIMNRFRRDR